MTSELSSDACSAPSAGVSLGQRGHLRASYLPSVLKTLTRAFIATALVVAAGCSQPDGLSVDGAYQGQHRDQRQGPRVFTHGRGTHGARPGSRFTCPAGSSLAIQELLYFGRNMPSGQVSAAQWTAFVDQVVTPAFPNGFSAWEASGQWQSATGSIIKEPSYVLNVIHPSGAAYDLAIEQIITAYKTAFQQESVLRVTSSACMGF